jgi:hypothetical protein
MSKVLGSKKPNLPEPLPNRDDKLGVRDTDFLLRLIKRSSFDGTDIEIAYAVITKLGNMHRSNLES